MVWKPRFLRRFGKRIKKKKAVAKKPAEGKPFSAEEIRLAELAASTPQFIHACKSQGLEPKKAFLRVYRDLQEKSEKITAIEFDAMQAAKAAGVEFDEGAFYIRVIAGLIRGADKNGSLFKE